MNKIAIVTDSNSGLKPSEVEGRNIYIVPMPFLIDGEEYFEGINLDNDGFYEKLNSGSSVSTSQPSIFSIQNLWDELLKKYDHIIYMPMSSGLSGSCHAAVMLSEEYDGKVHVVDNHRISVTMRQSVLDALELSKAGLDGKAIKEKLEEIKGESSIYIMVDTMHYLKKGGRVTPAAAALGTLLRIKPVLSIQGEKLDLFSKARTVKNAKTTMIAQIKKEFEERFNSPDGANMHLAVAYTCDKEAATQWKEEVEAEFPGCEVVMSPLSLSVSCHIGPGAIAIACSKKMNVE